MTLGGPHTQRQRRPSVLDAEQPPSEFMAAQQAAADTSNAAVLPHRPRARTNSSALGINGVAGGSGAVDGESAELQNTRALEVLDRVNQKLTGRDFKVNEELEVVAQVNKLIVEATKFENLCQHYVGWCSFW